MELTLTKKYLNLPVTTGAQKRRMRMLIDGEVVREFDIELAEGEPAFWVFMDVTEFAGRKASLEVQPPLAELVIKQAAKIQGAENLYREKLRPQFHFSSRRGWNNDPNGLVYYKGEFHLFYQHNPYGWNWGNMHWGHAVSKDLLHWRELPVAIYPDEHGAIFSGSAAVDQANTSGFQSGSNKPIVAAFTYAGKPFTQGIAYSNDRGRSWTKFEGNPVVGNITGGSDRDPRILWHQPTGKWVMVLYLDQADNPRFGFFTSPDLKSWTKTSELPGFFECPDLFELPVDGQSANTRWVLYGAAGEYLVGHFDGRTFTPAQDRAPLSRGNCFYAAQTFSNVPAKDGRRIQIGWGQVPAPDMPFNQMMLFPCDLSLRTTADGIRLCARPVKEIDKLHGPCHTWRDETVSEGVNLLAGISAELLDIRADIAVGNAKTITFNIHGAAVTYDVAEQTLTCRDKAAPLAPVDGAIRLQLLVDRTSIEIFGNDGLVYMPMAALPADGNPSPELAVTGGQVKIARLEVCELQSIWR